MSKVLFVGTGDKRRKYAGQTIDSTYEFAGFDPDSPPIPGQAVALTAPGVVGYGESGDLPYGIIEHVESDGVVSISRYGITREAHVVAGLTTPGVLNVTVNGAGLLQAGADGAGRTALIDMFAVRDDSIRVAALTLV